MAVVAAGGWTGPATVVGTVRADGQTMAEAHAVCYNRREEVGRVRFAVPPTGVACRNAETLAQPPSEPMRNIEHGPDSVGLESLLGSVDQPGDYYTHGRMFAAMPVVSVEGVGTLSFPVPEAQVRALLRVADRAPYGKGPDTLVDTSVRDCWQIDAAKVRLQGVGWSGTFAKILGVVARGLGCPEGGLDARLYKLLVYEQDGFFSAHRDTEKAEGMIATLSCSLPTAGSGGELIVRHGDRETTIDMGAEEPSEMAFAAFYADCTHETRPILDGHRISLVYNLCVRPDDTRTPRKAPDHSVVAERIAQRLVTRNERDGTRDGPPAIVWLLDHLYSGAGLSFDTLKNRDKAVARTLALAADRAGWELHAAIVHVEEEGTAEFGGDPVDYWDGPADGAHEAVMGELFHSASWLGDWVGRDGRTPPFGEVPLHVAELLPRGALDEAEPDEQRLHEASGNGGVSLERSYRLGALAMWPRAATVDVVAAGSAGAAVAWIEARRNDPSHPAGIKAEDLASRLMDVWPTGAPADDRAAMLRLLATLRSATLATRFVREVLLVDYDGGENADLVPVVELIEPREAGELLTALVARVLASRLAEVVGLLRGVADRMLDPEREGWGAALRKCVGVLLAELPAALAPEDNATEWAWPPVRQPSLGARATTDLFLLAARCASSEEAEAAARTVVEHPAAVTPERTLPAALAAMRTREGMAAGAPYAELWSHAARALLDRSATPPEAPRDWVIAADLSCDCEHCERLRAFCVDPVARVARYPLRKHLPRRSPEANRMTPAGMSLVSSRRPPRGLPGCGPTG